MTSYPCISSPQPHLRFRQLKVPTSNSPFSAQDTICRSGKYIAASRYYNSILRQLSHTGFYQLFHHQNLSNRRQDLPHYLYYRCRCRRARCRCRPTTCRRSGQWSSTDGLSSFCLFLLFSRGLRGSSRLYM